MDKVEEIASNKGYQITTCGKVLGVSGKELSSNNIDKYGYKRFTFRYKGKFFTLNFHRLQAFQKYGYRIYEEGIEVRHLNGDSLDNTWDNIAIGTHSENHMDIPKQVRISRALNATKKVRKYNKEEVKRFHTKYNSYKKTMEEFDISSKGTLNYILNN